MTAAQRLRMLETLDNQHLSAQLLKTYAPEELTSACDRMELAEVFESFSEQEALLQKAILDHADFLPVVKALLDAEVLPGEIQSLMLSAKQQDVAFFELTAEQILAVRQLELNGEARRWQMFLYYGEYLFNMPQRSVIVRNLNRFYRQQRFQLGELTDGQRSMMLLPFWASYVSSMECNVEAALEVVPTNIALQRMLTSMHDAGVQMIFTPAEWRSLRHVTADDADLIAQLLPLVEESCLSGGRFFDQWLENGCHTYDLQQLIVQLPQMEREKQAELFATHLTYVAGLYGKQLEGLALNKLDEEQTRVLIYAIAQKQNAFLKLVKQHYDAFRNLPNASMLFNASFYERICLNSMTERDLLSCAHVSTDPIHLGYLTEGQYTFAELKTLVYAPKQYACLYNRLLDQGVDKRLLLIRQLLKHRWLPAILDDSRLDELALRLKEKPFDRWLREDMQHIVRLAPTDAVHLLSCWPELQRFVPDMRTGEEVCFAIRNRHRLDEYALWANARDNMVSLDDDWKELCREYDFPKKFLQEHEQGVLRFIAHEGAGIAHTFWRRQQNSREDLRKIIQAEVMGRLPELKYHLDDLSRELNLLISDKQKTVWMENKEMQDGAFTAREHDDFYTTMQIGEIPTHTCLSYKDGSQANCLLSWFDANKKFLMAYKQGVPVARAMIRLTKGGCFASNKQAKLSFADLQEDAHPHSTEELVLFLERIYTNGLRNEDIQAVSELFIRLMKEKAQMLGAVLVVGDGAMYLNDKQTELSSSFLHISYSIYISRSKAGAQYLDSLSGAKSIENEGKYHSGMFYVLDENR